MSGIARKVMSVLKGPEGAWDLSFAYYDPPESYRWDISTRGSISLIFSDTQFRPEGFFFKPDGTKMYDVGLTTDDVNEYDLSTPWDVSTASFLQSIAISSEPYGIFFKPDGTRMYVIFAQSDFIRAYDLSTAWDISSASGGETLFVGTQESFPTGLFFKPDGTKLYVVGLGGDEVNEYDLSTAWDISSASFLQNFSVASQETAPDGLFFKPDGTKMYVIGESGTYEYDLSTAWDVSSASFFQDDPLSGEDVFFKPDGVVIYQLLESTEQVRQYSLGGFDVSDKGTLRVISFKPDGTKMYIGAEGAIDGIFEYDLSTSWDVSTASFLQHFSTASQTANPRGLFFKPDGTKMYVVGNAIVNEYDLSTAWDVSSASFLQNFSVVAQETDAWDLFFKPDGTKMYVVGNTGNDVGEYDLSTAWDVSTASFLQNFSVNAQETFPHGLFFKPDGTKMYILGRSGTLHEYDLSTAWDVSSASFFQNFSVRSEESFATALFFKPNGTQMFVSGTNPDRVFSYTLGPQD